MGPVKFPFLSQVSIFCFSLESDLAVKSCGGFGSLPALQASELSCHSFVDAIRKHKTQRSEMRDSSIFTVIAVARALSLWACVSSQSLNFCGLGRIRVHGTGAGTGLH